MGGSSRAMVEAAEDDAMVESRRDFWIINKADDALQD